MKNLDNLYSNEYYELTGALMKRAERPDSKYKYIGCVERVDFEDELPHYTVMVAETECCEPYEKTVKLKGPCKGSVLYRSEFSTNTYCSAEIKIIGNDKIDDFKIKEYNDSIEGKEE